LEGPRNGWPWRPDYGLWQGLCAIALAAASFGHGPAVAGFNASNLPCLPPTAAGGRAAERAHVAGFLGDGRGIVAPASNTGLWFWLGVALVGALVVSG